MPSPILPNNFEEDNCKRVASRNGLAFHVHGGYVTTHAGWKSETREATDEERALWEIMLPSGFDEGILPATEAEVDDCIPYHDGPFTVSSWDLAVIRKLGDKVFKPCNQRELLLQGLVGWILNPRLECMTWDPVTEVPIYVSRYIPVGFYYDEGVVPELNWQPSGEGRELRPPLADELVWKIRFGLKPFIT